MLLRAGVGGGGGGSRPFNEGKPVGSPSSML